MVSLLIFLNVLLVTGAQLALKFGAARVVGIDKSEGFIQLILKTVLNSYLIMGTLLYVFSLVLWIYILTKAKLSFAYPAMSLSYIVVMFFSFYFFKETVNLYQWIGVFLIVSGVTLMFVFKG